MFYFTVNNPQDPLSTEIVETNRRDLAFWHRLRPKDDDDLATAINKICVRTGLSRKLIAACLFSICFLPYLPNFHKLVEKLGHLDMARINAITKAGEKVPSEKRELFDAYLVDYLTPRAEAQCLPQASSISAMMRKFIAQHCPDDNASSATNDGSIRYRRNNKGGISITVDATASEVTEIKAALEQMSKDKDCTPGASLLHIIRGLPTKVVLNTYGTKDSPEYLEGGTWLSKEQSEFWKTRTTSSRDMDAAHFSYTTAYAPTREMRVYIKGLRTTCSVPGCSVAVENCQLDHIIPWGEGGPTTPWNIHPLCVFHHIQKTEGRLQCYPLPDGTVLFLVDGIPVFSIPDGPLSKSNKTWGTKFGKYMERRIAA
ncbi:HNH endonuclease signature motif containing protein [Corynebacterium glutamicum]|uniref:HNH endonuclease signature motif containing protein n=1 Tax=Corynebacterium glutamicum TaxID=1718 RepID=UPI000942C855|nr:HNH endonuclease signature motif containing protein [Corynebacterium glutamicum]OKX89429.1 HNH endonuclease [Corynebacterium glutamicum]QDX74993.1 hypothetical protein AKL15_04135 [Corynebacterium glutamicum]QDX77756.1 hypothetical protein AKL16_04135 [Corynebacterium glutamicum]TWS33652.1 hypothetical protein AKJ20_07975 [Corynebacterium glutamicum]TWS34120.1 hypothetical protein AKJ19_06225 [Corynebacterium glutamicum]